LNGTLADSPNTKPPRWPSAKRRRRYSLRYSRSALAIGTVRLPFFDFGSISPSIRSQPCSTRMKPAARSTFDQSSARSPVHKIACAPGARRFDELADRPRERRRHDHRRRLHLAHPATASTSAPTPLRTPQRVPSTTSSPGSCARARTAAPGGVGVSVEPPEGALLVAIENGTAHPSLVVEPRAA
jgi:hypothetical protein